MTEAMEFIEIICENKSCIGSYSEQLKENKKNNNQ